MQELCIQSLAPKAEGRLAWILSYENSISIKPQGLKVYAYYNLYQISKSLYTLLKSYSAHTTYHMFMYEYALF